ncbi:FAS1 domain-containing protein [Apodospora peruviana]|uniref:FAS1 domain-containing protein n=1 Tax=Apodospora peruviana TaxID=516989 RepID=A0AAE0HRW9_9PEZI|nr:FAS1 domain-containing protein [Apodospora peruviana]
MGVSIFTGGGAESKVTKADLNFTSGTIHIIDKVLTIPANLTSVLMSSPPDLSSLTGAVTKANLAQTLSDVPQLTIFAPNNAAFEAISDVAAGLTVEQLTAVLGYHAIAGAVVYSTDITTTTMNVKTVEGSEVMVRVEDGNVMVNDAKVIMPNILIKNGVVHVIDG